MNESRDAILDHLREGRSKSTPSPGLYRPTHDWDREQNIERLTRQMTAVRTEVHRLTDGDWMAWLNEQLPERQLTRVLVGDHESGKRFSQAADDALRVRRYQQDIEQWKPELFSDIDVGITSTRGGIAETGSLILWPDSTEPRLLSLVPPVHIALLEADSIFNTFADAMQEQDWANQMPTNALLISGPSKTADIEQTLAYGIHGPKQLIVLLLG